jgi:hypothetical protein
VVKPRSAWQKTLSSKGAVPGYNLGIQGLIDLSLNSPIP